MNLIRPRFLMNATAGEAPTGAGATPPAAAPAAASTAAAPAAAAAPAIESITLPKDAFDERLAKAASAAERKFLKDLGFDKPEDAKAALGKLRTLEDAQKTDRERLEGRIKELEPKASRADVLSKRFEATVTAEFNALDEKVRTAIDKLADGDADKRYEQMEFLRASGLLGATAAAPAAAPPASAPKTTGPAGGPPPPANGAKSKFDEWSALREKNPVQASIFFRTNRAAIEASRPADQ